jgi:hypothetical protein
MGIDRDKSAAVPYVSEDDPDADARLLIDSFKGTETTCNEIADALYLRGELTLLQMKAGADQRRLATDSHCCQDRPTKRD